MIEVKNITRNNVRLGSQRPELSTILREELSRLRVAFTKTNVVDISSIEIEAIIELLVFRLFLYEYKKAP